MESVFSLSLDCVGTVVADSVTMKCVCVCVCVYVCVCVCVLSQPIASERLRNDALYVLTLGQ